ncbi:MAG: 3-deoxy-manno-octulosonate cytidylyltransferase, partial [Alphaproteobacteria bacterium]
MNPIILIPARMSATRLPGKPLALIDGVPMIVRALQCALDAGI